MCFNLILIFKEKMRLLRFKKKCLCFIVLLCLAQLLILWFVTSIGDLKSYFYIQSEGPTFITFSEISDNSTKLKVKNKLILFWSEIYGSLSLKSWGIHSDILDNCSYKCDFTIDRNLEEQSDALLFHGDFYLGTENPMPRKRSPNQLYIFYLGESPSYTFLKLQSWEGFFNWTMTYRRNSDVYNPYGQFVRLGPGEKPSKKPTTESIKNKKLAAWLVSSCGSPSKRENFVKDLQKYINVDIFGSCGEPCPHSGDDCLKYIGENYKFYLSLENSRCEDYITEKFFNPYIYSMVPITNALGVQNLAPPGSYISLTDFTNTTELARYLKELDQDHDKYLNYFNWKSDFKIGDGQKGPMCNLCTKITNFKPEEKSVIKSLYNWWWLSEDGQPICIDNIGLFGYLNNFLEYAFGYRF